MIRGITILIGMTTVRFTGQWGILSDIFHPGVSVLVTVTLIILHGIPLTMITGIHHTIIHTGEDIITDGTMVIITIGIIIQIMTITVQTEYTMAREEE